MNTIKTVKSNPAREQSFADVVADADRKTIAHMRIARVSYNDYPIMEGGTATIGEIVDQHIETSIMQGGLVSEVCLYFETREQQEEVARMYNRRNR